MDLIDRNNLENLTKNDNHSFMSNEMKEFAKGLKIKTIDDMVYFDKAYYTYFRSPNSDEEKESIDFQKFKLDAKEIFERKVYGGCSDRGISIAPILRYLGIPTVYLEAAKIEWIEKIQEDIKKVNSMAGHIFLEIYLDNKWYLYDPTFHLVYDNYDFNNSCLPRNYVAFSKGMNQKSLGVIDVKSEQKLAYDSLKDYDLSTYKDPEYKEINVFYKDVLKEKQNRQ